MIFSNAFFLSYSLLCHKVEIWVYAQTQIKEK